MPDELDDLLQGSDQDASSDSPSGNQNDGSNSDNQSNGTGGQTTEEVEFSRLSGSAQDRFRVVLKEREQLRRELDLFRNGTQNFAPQQQTQQQDNPQVADAVNKLREVGLTTKKDVEEMLQSTLAQTRYQLELNRLEDSFNGSDGKPKFTREEYFDYVGRHPEYKDYLPEDVYGKMYSEELDDWKAQNRNRGGNSGQRSSSLRPTRTNVQGDQLTPESIEETLQKLPPDQRQTWYNKNIDKINQVMNRMGGQ